jgi:hypothetical protein
MSANNSQSRACTTELWLDPARRDPGPPGCAGMPASGHRRSNQSSCGNMQYEAHNVSQLWMCCCATDFGRGKLSAYLKPSMMSIRTSAPCRCSRSRSVSRQLRGACTRRNGVPLIECMLQTPVRQEQVARTRHRQQCGQVQDT